MNLVDGYQRAGGAGRGHRGSGDGLQQPALEGHGSDSARSTRHAGGCAPTDRGGQNRVLQGDRGRYGQHHRQAAPLTLESLAILAAPLADAQMSADVPAPEPGAVHRRELLANLRAVGFARRASGQQRFPGLEHERFDLLARDAEDRADLTVTEGLELGEDQRRSLILRKALHIDHQVSEILAALNLARQALRDRLDALARGLLAAGANDRETAITGDREEPRPQCDRLLRVHDVLVGREKRVLDGVLGLLVIAEHVPAEREDRAVMAIVCGLERGRAALSDQGDEMGIGREPKRPSGRHPHYPCRRPPRHRTGFHGADYLGCTRKTPCSGKLSCLGGQTGASPRAASARRSRGRGYPQIMAFFSYEGHRLAYTSRGQGPRTTILIPGLLLPQKMQAPLARSLANRGNRVVTFDPLGHGDSERPRNVSLYSMTEFARQTVALLDHLELGEAIVGGTSMGANITLEVASIAPERLRGMIVEMPVLDHAIAACAAVFTPLLLALKFGAPGMRAVARVARRVPRASLPLLITLGLDSLSQDPGPSAAVLQGILFGRTAPDRSERMTFQAPALIIGHPRDPVHPFSDADMLAAELPNARLIDAKSIVELRVRPERLTAQIAEFVEGCWAEPEAAVSHGRRAKSA